LACGQESDPYATGIQAFQRGNATEALQLFERAAQVYPHDARVANALGNAWQALHYPSKAREEYLRALSLDPKLDAAKKNLGIQEFQQKDLPAAAHHLASVTQTSPRDAVAWCFLGLTLEAQHDPRDAMAAFARSLAINDSDAAVRLDLASVEAASGYTLAAISDYHRLTQDSGLEVGAQEAVGIGLERLNDVPGAISQFQFIRARHPSSEAAVLALARLYAQNHQPDEALSTLESALSAVEDKASLYALIGTIDQQYGRSDAAAKAYREAILADPKRPEPYLQLSSLYLDFRHFDAAATTLREGIRFVAEPDDLKLQLGTTLVMGGREQDAIPVLREVISSRPHNPAAYTTLVIAYTMLDPSDARALDVAEQALKMCPPNYLTYYLHAGLLYRIHRENFAQSTSPVVVRLIKSEMNESIHLNPNFPHSFYDLARVEFETGNYPASEREARAALAADKDFMEARYLLGRIYLKEGRTADGHAEMARVEHEHMDEIREVESMGQVLLAQQAAALGSRAVTPPEAGEVVGENTSR
jgi:tetratricopeptide (TPR) repeat protein